MMLGFTVTTSVFTPTSMVYFSEIGGRLHLQKRPGSPEACSQPFQMEFGQGFREERDADHMSRGMQRWPAEWNLCGLGMEGPIQSLLPPTLSSPIIANL